MDQYEERMRMKLEKVGKAKGTEDVAKKEDGDTKESLRDKREIMHPLKEIEHCWINMPSG